MTKLQHTRMLLTVLLSLGVAWGQDDSTTQTAPPAPAQNTPAQNTPNLPQEPVPAYGVENAPAPITENPPISGLDQPGLEPHAAPLSYLQPGVTVSESADSNIGNNLGGQAVHSVTRALGWATMERLWSHYDLGLDYAGGAGYYNTQGQGFKSLQQMDLDQRVMWKRGQLSLRDSFSYLPEGNFGGAYGSLGTFGISSLGSLPLQGVLSESSLGSLGEAPRIINGSAVDVAESLSPKSAVTAIGGYAFTHFYGSDAETGGTFLNSSESTVMVGYDRILTTHIQAAAVYGYQNFDFSVEGTAIRANIGQLMFGYRISGRMDLTLGAGPEFVHVEFPCPLLDAELGVPPCSLNSTTGLPVGSIGENRIGGAGRASLRYRYPKTLVDLMYARMLTSGSGLFAGAQTDIARLGVSRPLTRVWSGMANIGFSRNSRPAAVALGAGVNANVFDSGFAGIAVHRMLGHDFHAFASYQFNTVWFDHSYCGNAPACNRISNRQIGTVGVEWTPRPIRLD
jgi:hypothetical protein